MSLGSVAAGQKSHRKQADYIECDPFLSASDFNNFIHENNDLSGDEVALLEHARDELRRHRRWLMTDAEFFVQARKRSFRFHAGTGINKFICYEEKSQEPGGKSRPVAYLELGGLTKKLKKISGTETSPDGAQQEDDAHDEEHKPSTGTGQSNTAGGSKLGVAVSVLRGITGR